MKKILVVFLCCIMSLGSFAACGSSDNLDYDKLLDKFDGEIEHNVKIKVLENDTAVKMGYMKTLLDAFNLVYADKGVKAIDAKLNEFVDLETDGPYGFGPDLLYQANDQLMQFADGMHLLPLPVDKVDATAQISDTAYNAYTLKRDGKPYVYGVPVNVQAPMLYYRKDLLPKDWKTKWDKNTNNIPDMLETWSDMYNFNKIYNDAANKKYGFMMSIQNVYFNSGFLFSYGGYVFGGNNDDIKDIGFAKGEAEKGGRIMRQLASVMDETCIDDSITTSAYNKLGRGEYFATVSTPDTYERFIKEFINEQTGKTDAEKEKYARENLLITDLPRIPVSGDLSLPIENIETDTKEITSMGGINGYGISAYTKHPKAALAFVDFATKFDMIKERAIKLGIAPARKDVAKEVGGLSETLFNKIDKGKISIMPSIKEVDQLWSPCETFFADLAKDPYKKTADVEYDTLPKIKAGLEQMSKNLYDSIHTLS